MDEVKPMGNICNDENTDYSEELEKCQAGSKVISQASSISVCC